MPKKPNGYWTEKTILKELKIIISEIGHFPTHKEIYEINKSGLSRVIKEHGGSAYFQDMMGYNVTKRPDGYWTNDIIIKELKKIIIECECFPTREKLYIMNKGGLVNAIAEGGGFPYFRKLMGYDYLRKPRGYWNDDTIIDALKTIINKLNHFPSIYDLENMQNLLGAINTHGGYNKFRIVLGYSVSDYEQYRAKLSGYCSRRGKKTEDIFKNILIDWCGSNIHPHPSYNVKLSKSHIIEFICNTGKTIGIDVTNTKHKSGSQIRNKWRKKSYHLHLDELWIVVFSNIFTEKDYFKFNEESPYNVKVMSIDTFLKELKITTDENIINKIENYKKCTFHTKEEFIGINQLNQETLINTRIDSSNK